MLSIHVSTLQKLQIPPRFNAHLVINKCTTALILGMFAKFRKVTVGFTMAVHLSTSNSLAPTVWISNKFNVWVFFENPVRKFKFHDTQTITMDTLREQQYTFLIISRSILLRTRNISEKRCRENQNTFCLQQLFFFGKSGPLCDNVEKYCRAGQDTDDNMVTCTACWIPEATNTHSEYVIVIAFWQQRWLQ